MKKDFKYTIYIYIFYGMIYFLRCKERNMVKISLGKPDVKRMVI